MGVGGISSGKWCPDKQSVAAGAAPSVPAAARSDEITSNLNLKKRFLMSNFFFNRKEFRSASSMK